MGSDRLPRKLAAILYADVAGYSRLTGEDKDSTLRRLSEWRRPDMLSPTEHRVGSRRCCAGMESIAGSATLTTGTVWVVLVLVALCTQAVLADVASWEQSMEAGRGAFSEGVYDLTIAEFEAAVLEVEGLDDAGASLIETLD